MSRIELVVTRSQLKRFDHSTTGSARIRQTVLCFVISMFVDYSSRTIVMARAGKSSGWQKKNHRATHAICSSLLVYWLRVPWISGVVPIDTSTMELCPGTFLLYRGAGGLFHVVVCLVVGREGVGGVNQVMLSWFLTRTFDRCLHYWGKHWWV